MLNQKSNEISLVRSKPKFSLKRISGVVTAVSVSALITANAHAGDVVLPTIDVANMIGFMGLLVTAVATVATANLMIPMVAKGIKSIRTVF